MFLENADYLFLIILYTYFYICLYNVRNMYEPMLLFNSLYLKI